MTSPFSYTTTFTLDKAHFNECFSQSVNSEFSIRAYIKAMVLAGVGLLSFYIPDVSTYFSWFMIGLGVLDALSVYYQRPWWVARQMLSKAANSEVTLEINEQGIKTKSFYVDSQLDWSEIGSLAETELGFLITATKGGRHYISNTCLSEQAKQYLRAKQAS